MLGFALGRSLGFTLATSALIVAACAQGEGIPASTGRSGGVGGGPIGIAGMGRAGGPGIGGEGGRSEAGSGPGGFGVAGIGVGGAGEAGQGGSATAGAAGSGPAGASGAGIAGSAGSGIAGAAGAGGAPGPTCIYSSADPTCNTCLKTQCEQTCTTCSSNTSCVNLEECYGTCSTNACWDACDAQFPSGIAPFEAFAGTDGCMGMKCHTPCGYKCGITFTAQACTDCANQYCYGECRACVNEADCLDLWDCYDLCGSDNACQLSCELYYADGITPLDNFAGNTGCLATHCASACGW